MGPSPDALNYILINNWNSLPVIGKGNFYNQAPDDDIMFLLSIHLQLELSAY